MMSPTDPDFPLTFTVAVLILFPIAALLWRLGKPPARRVKWWESQERKGLSRNSNWPWN
jgi:peptidoglycan/LPS O-acetylase OafA/YrhL